LKIIHILAPPQSFSFFSSLLREKIKIGKDYRWGRNLYFSDLLFFASGEPFSVIFKWQFSRNFSDQGEEEREGSRKERSQK